MSAISLVRAYRFLFAGLIALASAQALTMHEHHAALLGAAEIAGALLFVWRHTQIAGSGVLLTVFVCAQALSMSHGEWPTHLLQYAATTIFIVFLDRRLAASV